MVTGKSPIMPMTWAAHGQPLSDASEEVPMVTQLDEERRHMWEVVKANLERHTSGTRILRTSLDER